MFKFLSRRQLHKMKEASNKINTETTEKIDRMSKMKNLFTRIKLRITPSLNLRVKINNLLPNKYPLTTILIGLNLYKYFYLFF